MIDRSRVLSKMFKELHAKANRDVLQMVSGVVGSTSLGYTQEYLRCGHCYASVTQHTQTDKCLWGPRYYTRFECANFHCYKKDRLFRMGDDIYKSREGLHYHQACVPDDQAHTVTHVARSR